MSRNWGGPLLDPVSARNWDTLDLHNLVYIPAKRTIPVKHDDEAGSYTESPGSVTDIEVAMSYFGKKTSIVVKEETEIKIGDFVLVPVQ